MKYYTGIEYGEQWPIPLDYGDTVQSLETQYNEGTASPICGDGMNARRVEQIRLQHPSNFK